MRKLKSQIRLLEVRPSVNDGVGFDVRAIPLCHSPCSVLTHHLRRENPKSDYHSRPLPWSPNPYTPFLCRNPYLDVKGNRLPYEAAPLVIPSMVLGGVFWPPSLSQSITRLWRNSTDFQTSLSFPLLPLLSGPCHFLPQMSHTSYSLCHQDLRTLAYPPVSCQK